MNRYPAWKYAIVAVALLVSIVYALPNLFGEVPAVEVSGKRTAIRVDEELRDKIEAALRSAHVTPTGADLKDGKLSLRFADTDEQLKARDIAQANIDANAYGAALNLVPNSPRWLQALGAKPMYLGLDLRGGVHFLLQVDMKTAAVKQVERYASDVRSTLRDKKIYYSGLTREGDRIVIRFREKDQEAAALRELGADMPDLDVREQDTGAEGQLVATVKPQVVKANQEAALQQNIQTLRNRVNELGVAEPIVQQQGADRIIVELAGVQDPEHAKEIIGRTATLEIRLVAEEYAQGRGEDAFAQYKDQPAPFGTDKFYDQRNGAPVLVRRSLVIGGDRITDAQANFDQQTGSPVVNVKLDSAGGRVMRQVTRENVGKRMAILLVEKTGTAVAMWPTIQEEFGANFRITGLQDINEAKDLALLLRAGALAANMDIIEERTVGPSLGKENIEKGFHAVLWGFAAIAVFMSLYYVMFGLISVVALACNLLFLVALLSMLQATLTLPGIAAIALTLGMAIDANVLINERVREELRAGMTPQMSIQAGYERAFGTILDSNVTTLIVGLMLLAFGSGPVRGFAVVHCLGILTSIFSAVVVSRGIVNLIYGGRRKVPKLSIGDTSWHQPGKAAV
ncbi:MAG TPA: protein translocase subunit SecD [Usitatibacter sp.]|nr:protein translocase subunit SecD [Usitatibacter sp.]